MLVLKKAKSNRKSRIIKFFYDFLSDKKYDETNKKKMRIIEAQPYEIN